MAKVIPATVENDSDSMHPTGGWGSLQGIIETLEKEGNPTAAIKMLQHLNKPKGVMCPSCAWGKSAKPDAFEFCENGAKAVLWELTSKRCSPDFFASHTVSELLGWSDYNLEQSGRLTHPLRYDAGADKYHPVSWAAAFAEIGQILAANKDPKSSVFYSAGHAGLEASFLYALFARAYGHLNLPQSSNMCHETTSVNLKRLIGTPVGTCTLNDFEHCDVILFFGQNPGTNSPRFLHDLQRAKKRGCKIVVFNPIRESGLLEFINPQNPLQMLTDSPTVLSEHYYQLKPGGDIAVIAGMIKYLLAAEEKNPGSVLDQEFIAQETTGFQEMLVAVSGYAWKDIEQHSGLARADIEQAAAIYMAGQRVVAVYGMGLTQHVQGWLNLGMLINLLLIRGNIGRQGAGICPVRGHSNVQGQRTVGISPDPAQMPAERLKALFNIDQPTQPGCNITEACEKLLDGSIKSLLSLGGNLLRALPDSTRLEAAWGSMDLTVYVATKLNRSHLVPGKVSFLLPCLGRTDLDMQQSGPQAISIEDSFSYVHGSIGTAAPPSADLKSEVAIVASIAQATLSEQQNQQLHWAQWTNNYDLIRDLIAETYPEDFYDFNDRLFQPGGFYRSNTARKRIWLTESGKAQFTTPTTLSALANDSEAADSDTMTLITLRSNDQFNTTIYGFSDRLRGLSGSRMVVLMHPDEMMRLGLTENQQVSLECAVEDGIKRTVKQLTVTPFNLPLGCVAGYYPELNPLVPLSLREIYSHTPAYKGTPVRVKAT